LQATQGPGKPIGIVSGHWGNGNDPGAVCPDGTKEQVVNLTIATLVRQKLEARGYQVDLLQEFDSRLDGYNGEVLLAIHTDTCDVINDQATGFKVANSTYSHDTNLANRLTACLDTRYASVTGLKLNPGGITENMTDYHAFRAVDQATTSAIIETGFLYLDKDILVNHPDIVADGIVAGLVCFVNNENVQLLPTP
jgi:N-acetylmuramoyl-L-alanine amidase